MGRPFLLICILVSSCLLSGDAARPDGGGNGGAGCEVCASKRVTYPDVCEQIAKANPSAKGTYGILQAHITVTKSKTTAAIAEAKRVSHLPKSDKMTKENLETCVDNFNAAIGSLGELSTALAAKDNSNALVQASGALAELVTCEDQFDDIMFTPDPKPSPINATTAELEKLGGNIVDLTAIIAHYNPPR